MKFLRTAPILYAIAALLALGSCTLPEPEKKETVFPAFDEKVSQVTDAGLMGVFKVPEMLVISILDSAAAREVPAKVAENYSALGKEMMALGLEVGGPVGQVMLNNDTSNFKFECFVPVKQRPAKLPGNRCEIKTLPAGNMLVLNYYGPYQQLFVGYGVMYEFIQKRGLKLNGATREFYITDPTVETDPEKLLTRIMAPVVETGTH